MEELINQIGSNLSEDIVAAIEAHAFPTYFDWIILASSLFAMVLTFIIYKRQTDIMEQQNRIALFEKRYQCYKAIQPLINVGIKYNKYTSEKYNKFSPHTNARLYLFNYLEEINMLYNYELNYQLQLTFIRDENKNFIDHDIVNMKSSDIEYVTPLIYAQIKDVTQKIEELSFLFPEHISIYFINFSELYNSLFNRIVNNAELGTLKDTGSLCSENGNRLLYEDSGLEKRKTQFCEYINKIKEDKILEEMKKQLQL